MRGDAKDAKDAKDATQNLSWKKGSAPPKNFLKNIFVSF